MEVSICSLHPGRLASGGGVGISSEFTVMTLLCDNVIARLQVTFRKRYLTYPVPRGTGRLGTTSKTKTPSRQIFPDRYVL